MARPLSRPLTAVDTAERQRGQFTQATQIQQQILEHSHQFAEGHQSVAITAPYTAAKDAMAPRFHQLRLLYPKSDIRLLTNDSSQGREFDITIFPTIRNDFRGFLSNPNRLTVAFSRAHYVCVIITDLQALQSSPLENNPLRKVFDLPTPPEAQPWIPHDTDIELKPIFD
ncbi:unnamed protein product [Bursaphelenchus xylophilus]|uniref:(pine wood nematode) hypothetical protein n=1 Tax=Bursaphelenchus xylophilus TaxID=6326 RepID=A0A1I7RUL3_BURXY|nr:unnamed protein product [Bursaphelenchus xylophilus]CAG9114201.1 unnamed protein product [Bursaphelenchus xylophilus]